jgi:hypothetical protein
VLYVYGAADRSGADRVDAVRTGLTNAGYQVDPEEFFIIDWGRFATNPRDADRRPLLDNRFGTSDAEARTLLRSVVRSKIAKHTVIRLLFGWYLDRLDILGSYRGVEQGAFPVLLDVFAYMRNTERIVTPSIQRIDFLVRTSTRPVIAIGLSLGGIILVDALSRWSRTVPEDSRSGLKLLTTVGSQSPMLYACDALLDIRRDGESPGTPFVPWLNIWRRLDLLSYPADPLFGGQVPGPKDLRDVVLDPGPDFEMFPEAHGSYFNDARVYAAIDQMLTDQQVDFAAPPPGAAADVLEPRAVAPFEIERQGGAMVTRL